MNFEPKLKLYCYFKQSCLYSTHIPPCVKIEIEINSAKLFQLFYLFLSEFSWCTLISNQHIKLVTRGFHKAISNEIGMRRSGVLSNNRIVYLYI